MNHKGQAMDETNAAMTDLDTRLAKARERTRAAEAKRAQAEEKSAGARAVEAAEIEADDAEAIAQAEDDHGAHRIAIVRTAIGCVIVKRPHPAVYKRFRDRGEAKTADLDALVRKSLVYPDAQRFDRMIEELPATLDHAANKVVELAGFKAKEVAGKS